MAEPEGRWCDGTPHHPQAIPPLPLHDYRWMGDDPYTECARCGRITAHDGRVIFEGRMSSTVGKD